MFRRLLVIELTVPDGLVFHLYDDCGEMLSEYNWNPAVESKYPKWVLVKKEEPIELFGWEFQNRKWYIRVREEEIKQLIEST